MSQEPGHSIPLDPRVAGAVEELQRMVQTHYPTTTFEVACAPDESASILVWATVDVDDPDKVLDLVQERLLEWQVDERLPIHLVPVRTPERILAEMESQRRLSS